jgi:hypothetical protein
MITDYISNYYPVLDYIHHGKNSVSFIKPPSLPEIEEIDFMASELAPVSKQKISELLDRFDFLENKRNSNLELIQKKADLENWDDFSEYFWTYLENYAYSEIVNVQSWLKYWTKIYELSAKVKFEPVYFEQKQEITDEDVARAKEFPIIELYQGDLKHSFGKHVGLCPFHTETTPSFTIFEDSNTYYCFGCNAWGDSIDFYRKIHNINMVEAVKELNAR